MKQLLYPVPPAWRRRIVLALLVIFLGPALLVLVAHQLAGWLGPLLPFILAGAALLAVLAVWRYLLLRRY